MDDRNILDEIAEAEQAYQDAKKKLSDAKKVWTQAETAVIETKINLDRFKEKLRVYRSVTPNYVVVEAREREIEEFRLRHPKLVEEARERDLEGSEEESES
jgi:hypothetical protein